MRPDASHHGAQQPSIQTSSVPPRSDWTTLNRLLPYLWPYKWRVLAALTFMVAAKVSNVGVPLLLKELVDAFALPLGDARAVAVVPLGLLLAYGLLRSDPGCSNMVAKACKI